MKKSRLIIAAIALMGVAACAKIETPNVQDEPEVIAPEEIVVAEPNAEVKSVASALDNLCQINEVRKFIESLIVDIQKSEEPWHIDFSVAPPEPEDPDYTYICGSIGFTKGVFHPIVLDLDLLVMNRITIVGTIDAHQIVANYAHALQHIDDLAGDITAQYYLDKANEGLNITIGEALKFCFMVEVDEEGYRSIGLYIYQIENPDNKYPVPGLFTLLFGHMS
jgi:hypothetical protein